MRLSDLQDKDVVDLKSGVKIGNIIDIKINYETHTCAYYKDKE